MSNDPMSLEDLPKYLKSLKENGDTGDSNLVGMGIIENNKPWFKITALLICFILSAAVLTYNLISTQNFTVVADINENSDQTIQNIVSDSGGKIVSVKQNEDAIYEIKLDTRKSKRSFLDKFRKNKNVKKAILKD